MQGVRRVLRPVLHALRHAARCMLHAVCRLSCCLLPAGPAIFVSQTGTLTESLAPFLPAGSVVIDIAQYMGRNVVMHSNSYVFQSYHHLQASPNNSLHTVL